MFVWTLHVKEVDPGTGESKPSKLPHSPFVTWPIQDHALMTLYDCVENGRNALIDKSRDMGASWLCLIIGVWYWLFVPASHMKFVSRVEDLVDKTGDPDSIFYKIDYILTHLPQWMLPADKQFFEKGNKLRSHLQLINPAIGSTIAGEATTAHIGKGGRRRFIVFDEMAMMRDADNAWRGATDTTACKIANSTPYGAGTEFTKQRNRGLKTGSPIVVELGYWNHPDKGSGREWLIDQDGMTTGTAGRGYWSTPWFRHAIKDRDLIDIGQNILIDHTTSGSQFFNSPIVTQHMEVHAREPVRCEMLPDGTGFTESLHGRWFVWAELDSAGRPLPRTDYVAFADLSDGVGASNSVVAILDRDSGEFIAEYVDPYAPLYDLAEEVCTVGRGVFKGRRGLMYVGWEANGPGESWYQEFDRLRYRRVYYKRAIGSKGERRSVAYGWRSTRGSKRVLLSALSSAMSRNEISIHSRAGLAEMLDYVHLDDGSIGSAETRDLLAGAREAHGDRVIAYAGAVLMRKEVGEWEDPTESYAPGTLGHLHGHAELEGKDFGVKSTTNWSKIKHGT